MNTLLSGIEGFSSMTDLINFVPLICICQCQIVLMPQTFFKLAQKLPKKTKLYYIFSTTKYDKLKWR